MSFLVLLGIIAVVAFYAISIYNGLVTSRNGYKNAFAQIDVQLTRRYDLIPNLVETVKGYMKHERETLEAVIQARNSAVTGLSAAKANPGDPQAMQQLAGAENALGQTLARQAYNDSVMHYNNAREVFPSSIFANLFNFQAAELLAIESPEKREPVKVSFS